jgi:hypothetical protein
VNASYGVVWQEGAEPVAAGRLELLSRALRLDGLSEARPATREIAYDSLTAVRIGRNVDERLAGRPALLLERRSGPRIRLASVAQSSALGEIGERLAALSSGSAPGRRLAVVVPLKDGAEDAVRVLLEAGPPFDPAETALVRHQVFLTSAEAIFLFEARGSAEALEALLDEPELWKLAAAWQEHVAGPPRIAEDLYSWTRPESGVERALLTPGLRNAGA